MVIAIVAGVQNIRETTNDLVDDESFRSMFSSSYPCRGFNTYARTPQTNRVIRPKGENNRGLSLAGSFYGQTLMYNNASTKS